MRPFMRGIVFGTGRGWEWERATRVGRSFTSSSTGLRANAEGNDGERAVAGRHRSCLSGGHAAISAGHSCGGAPRRVEADRLLPDSRGTFEDRPDKMRVPACVDGIDRGVVANGGGAGQEPGGR